MENDEKKPVNDATETKTDVPSTHATSELALSPYLFISSFSEPIKKSPGRPRLERTVSAPPPKSPKAHKPPKFLVNFPPPFVIHDEGCDPWTLHCVCKETFTMGFLVCCEKCNTWQHGICVNMNPHTVPDNYLCPQCGNRPIRCRCNDNSNYRFNIIRCNSCGYYQHRTCAGLNYGPIPPDSYICSYCGKMKASYPIGTVPESIDLGTQSFTFSDEALGTLSKSVISGPFYSFLFSTIFEKTLTAREFCPLFYDHFREFFFVAHPLYTHGPTTIKKRNSLSSHFLSISRQLLLELYGIDNDVFIKTFDALIMQSIYKEPNFVEDDDEEEKMKKITFTENANFEVKDVKIQNYVVQPLPPKLDVREDGIYATCDLSQGQFIMPVDGFIGDVEEFNYDNGVDKSMYQIINTRFVLDGSHKKDCLIHKMKRSMEGNCILKLFTVGTTTCCGLFIGSPKCSHNNELVVDPITVNAGEELLLGIDFLPGFFNDISNWYHWNGTSERLPRAVTPDIKEAFGYQDTSFNQRSLSVKGKKVKPEYDEIKKKGRPKKKKNEVTEDPELSLFDMFEADDPGLFLFRVGEEMTVIDDTITVTLAPPTPGLRGRPRSVGRPKKTQNTSTSHARSSPKKSHHKKEAEVEGDYDEDAENEEASADEEAKDEEDKDKVEEKKKESKKYKKKKSRHMKVKSEAHEKDEEQEEAKDEEEKEEEEVEEKEEKTVKEEKEKTKKVKEEKERKKEEKKKAKTNYSGNKEIFSEEYEKKLVKGLSKVKYTPMKFGNPSDEMLSLIGF